MVRWAHWDLSGRPDLKAPLGRLDPLVKSVHRAPPGSKAPRDLTVMLELRVLRDRWDHQDPVVSKALRALQERRGLEDRSDRWGLLGELVQWDREGLLAMRVKMVPTAFAVSPDQQAQQDQTASLVLMVYQAPEVIRV